MFEKLLLSMLPQDFNLAATLELLTTAIQDFAAVKEAVVRIEGLLLAAPTTSGPTPATTSATLQLAAPTGNAEIVTAPIVEAVNPAPSPLEVASAAAVQSTLATQGDISPEAQAVLLDAANAQAQLPVQPVGSPPTAPIWGAAPATVTGA